MKSCTEQLKHWCLPCTGSIQGNLWDLLVKYCWRWKVLACSGRITEFMLNLVQSELTVYTLHSCVASQLPAPLPEIARFGTHRSKMNWSFAEHRKQQGTLSTPHPWFRRSTYSLPDFNFAAENSWLHSTSLNAFLVSWTVVWSIKNSGNFPFTPPTLLPNTRKRALEKALESRETSVYMDQLAFVT